MSKPVDFYFDYASPFAYLASERIAAELPDISIEYKPIFLGGFDNFSSGPPFSAAKMQYMVADADRFCRRYDIEMRYPAAFPIIAVYADRGALWALANGGFESYHRAMFRAAWVEDRNIRDKSVVIEIAAAAGLDADAFAAGLDDPALKEKLKTQTAEAQERGVFGVPTFFVGDEMFWGQDRLEWVWRAATGNDH